MLMTQQVQAASDQKFNGLPQALRQQLLNSAVKLRDTQNRFLGSGVILSHDPTTGETKILTAKHLLYVLAGKTDPPTWDPALLTAFQQQVSIYYDTNMTFNRDPAQNATISSVTELNQGTPDDWTYDLMILTSVDANLAQFAMTNFAYTKPEGRDFNYVLNATMYLDKTNQIFMQIGYGMATETAENVQKTKMPLGAAGTNQSKRLQYRFPQPTAKAITPHYNQRSDNKSLYALYRDGIELTADATDSSAEGDSGGPLFVIIPATGKYYLIGITAGADMAASEIPCPSGGALRVNNIATSLQYCYQTYIFESV